MKSARASHSLTTRLVVALAGPLLVLAGVLSVLVLPAAGLAVGLLLPLVIWAL